MTYEQMIEHAYRHRYINGLYYASEMLTQAHYDHFVLSEQEFQRRLQYNMPTPNHDDQDIIHFDTSCIYHVVLPVVTDMNKTLVSQAIVLVYLKRTPLIPYVRRNDWLSDPANHILFACNRDAGACWGIRAAIQNLFVSTPTPPPLSTLSREHRYAQVSKRKTARVPHAARAPHTAP